MFIWIQTNDPPPQKRKNNKAAKETEKEKKNGKLPFIPNLDFGRSESHNWWPVSLIDHYILWILNGQLSKDSHPS